jgi:hypothetical protein
VTLDEQQPSRIAVHSNITSNTQPTTEHGNIENEDYNLVNGDHLLSISAYTHVKRDDMSSLNVKMEGVSLEAKVEDDEEYESLDDYDTAAEWKVEGRIGEDGQREVIHYFDHGRSTLTPRLQAVASVDEKSVVEMKPVKDDAGFLGDQGVANGVNGVKREDVDQAAFQKHLHAVTSGMHSTTSAANDTNHFSRFTIRTILEDVPTFTDRWSARLPHDLHQRTFERCYSGKSPHSRRWWCYCLCDYV